MNTVILAAGQSSAISDTVGRIGSGGAALILALILYLGIKYGKLAQKKGLLVFLGLLFAASTANATGVWKTFEAFANIPTNILRQTPLLGDVGPAAPPILGVIWLWLKKASPAEAATVAFWLYVSSMGTGDGSIWWMMRQALIQLNTTIAG